MKYLIGCVSTLLVLNISNITYLYRLDHNKSTNKIFYELHYKASDYIAFPLSGRCNTPKSIKWFKCDGLQQWIGKFSFYE